MTTVVLVGLAAVLVLLAAGIVLARRFQRLNPTPSVRPLRRRTVADLVRERGVATVGGATAGATRRSDSRQPAAATTAPLFDPTPHPRSPAAEPGGPTTTPEPTAFEAARQVLEDGVDAGDAPWRRADRMMGREPGASWETAPTPVAPEPETPTDSAAPVEPPAADPPAPADRVEPEGPEPAELSESAEPSRQPAAVSSAVEPQPPAPVLRVVPDPEMTPLMGIPVVHAPGGVPTPLPRVAVARVDEQVVSLLPASHPRPVLVVISGTPQTVWLRVVDRDGEPVPDALVALFDDRGTEVDTAKTAQDGGGDLNAPHGGRFLLVARADGFQPRAATVAVDDGPVELAILLPRSCRVAGCVRIGDEPLGDARVVASHEGEVVDEVVTEPDGTFWFDDLVEGSYALAVEHERGSVTIGIHVAEGVEQPHVLDLAASAGGR